MKGQLLFYCEWNFHIVALNLKDRCQCIPRKNQKPTPSRYTTADYKKAMEMLRNRFLKYWGKEFFTGDVYLIFVSNYTRHDSDAHLKIVMDALEGSVLKNDFQISKHTAERRKQDFCSVTLYARENLLPIFSDNNIQSRNPFDVE
ncbi:hypothetical protein [Leptospira phage LE3]|uniref:Uncharacterized protein n=1 Tax=Leptospira phage LE3 TaxID=2041382 RepID=A0A343LE98_9CAUD|nr:hypothetical protein HWB33_gp68 [Leptospira phage LE3]ATN95008.1 hypothetical protein [Leptospira phage LE3]